MTDMPPEFNEDVTTENETTKNTYTADFNEKVRHSSREDSSGFPFSSHSSRAEEADSPDLTQAEPSDIERKQRVFVAPERFEDVYLDNESLFVVVGQYIDGTMTVATNIALRIIQRQAEIDDDGLDPKNYYTRIRINSGTSLQRINDILHSEDIEDRVCIIKHIGERGLLADELTDEKLARYRKILEKKRVTVILTAIEDDFERRRRPSKGLIHVGTIDVDAVFSNHLNYDFPEDAAFFDASIGVKRNLLEQHHASIVTVANPAQIGEIFLRFKEVSYKDEAELEARLVDIIENVTNQQRLARSFFENLNFNERLFGLLVALLNAPGFNTAYNIYDVEELYNLVTQTMIANMQNTSLRTHEQAFVDARMTGIHDLLETLGLSGRSGKGDSTVRFLDPLVQQNFHQQVANYHRLLWMLEDVLANILGDKVSVFFHSMKEVVVARLIGQFGIYQPSRLRALLNSLVVTNNANAILLAAYIVYPSAIQPQNHDFLRDILKEWMAAGNHSRHHLDAPLRLTYLQVSGLTLQNTYPVVHAQAEAVDSRDKSSSEQLQQTRKLLRNSLRQLVYRSVKHDVDTPILLGKMREDIEQSFHALKEEIDANPDIHENDKAGIYKEIQNLVNQVADEDSAYWTLIWLQEAITFLMIIFDDIARSSSPMVEEVVSEVLIPLIESGFTETGTIRQWNSDTDDEDILKELERLLKDIEVEESPVPARYQEENAAKDDESSMSAAWYVSVAIANYLFMQRAKIADELTTANSSSPAEAGTNPSDQEEVDSVGDAKTREDSGQEDSVNDSQEDEPTGESNDADNDLDDEDAETVSSAEPSAAKSAKTPQRVREQNLIDLYEYLIPMLRLVPYMLKATPYFGDLNGFFNGIQNSDKILKYYNIRANAYERKLTPLRKHPVWFSGILSTERGTASPLTSLPIEVALLALRHWFEVIWRYGDEQVEGWVNTVYPVMLKMVNDATLIERQYLRDALFSAGWVDSRYVQIRDMSRALVARAYIMDGYVMDLPLMTSTSLSLNELNKGAKRYGVVLLDATSTPWGKLPFMSGVYYQRAFEFIQRLSVLTPVYVGYLGYDGQTYLFGVNDERVSIPPINARGLRPRRRRDRLIMPVMEGLGFPDKNADKTHFVLVLSPVNLSNGFLERREIVDMDDLVSTALGSDEIHVTAEEWDPFALESDPQTQAPTSVTTFNWEWRNKFFILTSTPITLTSHLDDVIYSSYKEGKQLRLERSIRELIQIFPVGGEWMMLEDQRPLEVALHQQIIRTLRTLPVETLYEDLSQYELGINFRDYDALTAKLEQWVLMLDAQETARHPRDVTLTITWSVLMMALDDMEQVIALLENWYNTDERLKVRMATALTLLLFNFYSVTPISQHLPQGRLLLRLVSPLIEATHGRNEFERVLQIIVLWARETVWRDELISSSGLPIFQQAIRRLKDRTTIQQALMLVAYHEVLAGLQSVYLRSKLEAREFLKVLQGVIQYAFLPVNDREQNRHAFLDKKTVLDGHLLEELEMLCNTQVFRSSAYNRPLLNAFIQKIGYLNADATEPIQEIYHNLRAVADMMRLELYHKLGDVLPPIRQKDQRYGIFIVDVTSAQSQSMVEMSIALMRNVQRVLRTENQSNNILFTVHRLGRQELVFGNTNGSPTIKQLRHNQPRRNTPLVGPILDQYDSQKVGFVMVLSAIPVEDLPDWSEQADWIEHFWVYTTNRSWSLSVDVGATRQVNRKQDIQELTNEIVEKVIRR